MSNIISGSVPLLRRPYYPEYKLQSLLEGEVQQCDADIVYAELWQLVCKHMPGRQNDQEVGVFAPMVAGQIHREAFLPHSHINASARPSTMPRLKFVI